MHWIRPGACHLPGFLDSPAQVALLARCERLLNDPTSGAYVPTVRGGGRMRVRMLCLGRHWNPLTYRYEETRADFDGRPTPALPPDLATLGREVAARAGFAFDPDVCLVNWYGGDGRMGLHQDKDESPESLAAGLPVVSVSLGETARFLFGGTRRRAPVDHLELRSGDAFVFGGPARLCYHGVARIFPGTAPAAIAGRGRITLTFRQY